MKKHHGWIIVPFMGIVLACNLGKTPFVAFTPDNPPAKAIPIIPASETPAAWQPPEEPSATPYPSWTPESIIDGSDVVTTSADDGGTPPDPPSQSIRQLFIQQGGNGNALVWEPEPSQADSDTDGLPDEFEKWIADTFFPILNYHMDDHASIYEVMRLYQVTPLSHMPSSPIGEAEYYGPEGILLTFVVLYEDDYGDLVGGFTDHDGDAELIRILLVRQPDAPDSWGPITLIIGRHGDPLERYYPADFAWQDTHPIVWVSADKHAMYSTWEECDDYSLGFEYCGADAVIDYPVEPYVDGFNVGERHHPAFFRIPDSSLGLFTNEYAWANPPESIVDGVDLTANFCGGDDKDPRDREDECGGSIHNKWWPIPDWENQVDLANLIESYATRQYIALFGAHYTIEIYTGTEDGAGTDADITLWLTDANGARQWFGLLDDEGRNNFENGDVDSFQAGTWSMATPFQEMFVELTYYNRAIYAQNDLAWYLNKIVVIDNYAPRSTRSTFFTCNCWLDVAPSEDSYPSYVVLGPDM